jgi:hypothetical protein
MKVRLFDLVMNVLPTLLFIDSELNILAHEFVQLIFKLLSTRNKTSEWLITTKQYNVYLLSLLIGSEGLEPLKLM